MKWKWIYPCGLALFVLLNLADLFLTWRLVAVTGGAVAEGNPLARWCLHAFGWLGLAGYKLSLTLFVLSLVDLISRLRPRAARRLLTFSCSAVAAVVLYSCSLFWVLDISPTAPDASGPPPYTILE